MSEENVEVVRGFFAAVNAWLETYWADPSRPLADTPGVDEVFERMDPEAEWNWLFSSDVYQGRDQLLQAAADFVGTVRDWRIEVGELIEGKSDGVMAFLRVVARGKGSGAPVYQPVFSAVTVRNGRIARIEDHTERSEALEAAGLRE